MPGYPNGVDVDDRDFWSARGTVVFKPGERFQNELVATYQHFDSHGSPWLLTGINANPTGCAGGPCVFPLLFPSLVGLAAQQAALGARTVIPLSVRLDSDGTNLSLNNITTIELTDTLKIRNILGYDEAHTYLAFDDDGTALPILDSRILPSDTPVEQFTEELQVLGTSFNGRLEWILGGFYLDSPEPDRFIRSAAVMFGAPSEGGSKSGSGSKAVYGQGTYDLSAVVQNLKVTLGGRYTRDKFSNFSYSGPPSNEINATGSRGEFSAVTYTFGLDYQVTPETLLYFASRRGYRPGGANGRTPAGVQLPDFDPEYIADYELGVKSDWRLGAMPIRTNAAVYFQDYTDVQVQQVIATPAPFTINANAAGAELFGVELETLLELTQRLDLGINFDYLNFKYSSFESGVVGTQDLLAARKLNRPPVKYGINVNYRLPVSANVGDIALKANWLWQAESGDSKLQVGGLVPEFGLLNLAANWDHIRGGPVDVSVFATNVLDKTYSLGGLGPFDSFGFKTDRYGEPRMYGVRLRYSFGGE